jgi:hypothetical protein
MPRLKGHRRQQVAAASLRAVGTLMAGVLLGTMLSSLLQRAGELN